MQIAVAANVPAYEQGKEPSRSGHHPRKGGSLGQCLLQDDAPDGLNFRMLRTQFFDGEKTFTSPRHRHAFPQIRFGEQGVLNFAPGANIEAGDLCFFPRAAYYGPQLKDQGVSIALQYGFDGEHQEGPVWRKYRDQALQQLRARGRFEEGLFISTDPKTGAAQTLDAVFALHQEQYQLHTGKSFDYRPCAYEGPILLHPAAFAYYPVGPGVEMKQLGRFFDHKGPNGDTRIAMTRLTNGAEYRLGDDRAQIVWSRNSGMRLDGEAYPELTFAYSRRGEVSVVSGPEAIEIYTIVFPRLD
jgi:hypothetical protein